MDVITFPVNLLSILMHGVISLSDATSYDKKTFFLYVTGNALSFLMIFIFNTMIPKAVKMATQVHIITMSLEARSMSNLHKKRYHSL